MSEPFVFDEITGALERFVDEHVDEIARVDAEEIEDVLSPLRGMIDRRLSLAAASEILLRLFHTAESRFATIAGRMSLDTWLSILRRFPVQSLGNDCLANLMLGLVRYAATNTDSIVVKLRGTHRHAIVYATTDEQLLDAFRLVALARCLSNLGGRLRWVGKGRHLLPLHTDLLNLQDDPVVEAAVDAYERRRPRRTLLHDEGFLIPAESVQIELPLLLFTSMPGTTRLHVPGPDLFLLCPRLPQAVNAKPVLDLLRAYQDAIEDIFGTSVDAISHVLYALASRVFSSIIPITAVSDDVIELDAHDGTEEYRHRLEFMFALCQRTYLRFSQPDWVERLGDVTSPWAPDSVRGRDLVTSFFAAFAIKDEHRANIDVSLRRPLPFAFQSSSNVVCIDLLATLDFIAWIVDRAKEWYSSQHGDRFTLALKRWVEGSSAGLVVAWKTEVQITSGQHVEIDLLVLHGDVLYVIECKAYAKSRSFLRGDYDAVRRRRRRIEEAVQQARRAAVAVQEEFSRAERKVPKASSVEWVVCTPTQEFLCPADEYGHLTGGAPRVCTPEELLALFEAPAGI